MYKRQLDEPFKIVDVFDVSDIQRKLAGTPQELWERRTFRQDRIDAQKDTESIILCWSGFASSTQEEFRKDAFITGQWMEEFKFFEDELSYINDHIAIQYPAGI